MMTEYSKDAKPQLSSRDGGKADPKDEAWAHADSPPSSSAAAAVCGRENWHPVLVQFGPMQPTQSMVRFSLALDQLSIFFNL